MLSEPFFRLRTRCRVEKYALRADSDTRCISAARNPPMGTGCLRIVPTHTHTHRGHDIFVGGGALGSNISLALN